MLVNANLTEHAMPDRFSTRLRWTRFFVVLLLFLTLGALWSTTFGGPPSADPAAGPASRAAEALAESVSAAGPAPETGAAESDAMDPKMLIASLYILVLAGFVGFEVIGGVSPLLHTPLMSVTNAISAISVVGALVIAGSAQYDDTLSHWLGFFAVAAAMTNVVGGFLITDRMLRLFKTKGARA
jgi:NAD(P) transhydrogenase subunit alpha